MAAEPIAADLDLDFFLPFPLFPPADADAALAEGIVVRWLLWLLFENIQNLFIKYKNSIYILLKLKYFLNF
jgi:hypothetical protein